MITIRVYLYNITTLIGGTWELGSEEVETERGNGRKEREREREGDASALFCFTPFKYDSVFCEKLRYDTFVAKH